MESEREGKKVKLHFLGLDHGKLHYLINAVCVLDITGEKVSYHQQDAQGMQKEIWLRVFRKLWGLSQYLFVQPLFLVPILGSA